MALHHREETTDPLRFVRIADGRIDERIYSVWNRPKIATLRAGTNAKISHIDSCLRTVWNADYPVSKEKCSASWVSAEGWEWDSWHGLNFFREQFLFVVSPEVISARAFQGNLAENL